MRPFRKAITGLYTIKNERVIDIFSFGGLPPGQKRPELQKGSISATRLPIDLKF